MDNLAQEDETTNSLVFDFSRFDIVDRYWREGSSVRILMKNVKDATHRAMICPRSWEVDYPQLDKLYGSAQRTIHAVTEAIVACCKAIIGLVRNEENWKWTMGMIRKVDKAGGEIRLWVKIYQAESPSVVWSEEDLGFVLSIPETNVMDLFGLVPEFKKQLLSAFNSDELYHTPKMQYVKAPSELLLRPPYYLSIQASPTCITVQSSHSPSLEFLARYLDENCHHFRREISAIRHIFDSKGPPVVDIELHQNPFTPRSTPRSSAESSAESNAIYDTFTLNLKAALVSSGPVSPISPLILIRLVKDELGYELQSSDQDSWYFCSMGVLKGL